MEQNFKEDYIREQRRKEAERRARLAKIGIAVEDAKPTSRQTAGRPDAPAESRQPARQAQSGAASAPRRTAATQGVQRTATPSRPATRQNIGSRPTAARQTRPAQTQTRPQTRKEELDITESDIFKKSISEDESRAMMFALTGKAEAPDEGGDVDVIDMGFKRRPSTLGRTVTTAKKKRNSALTYIGRFFVCVGTALAMVIVTVYAALLLIAYGPSETVRDLAVNSAMQASATKWVPYLVLSKGSVEAILSKSEEVVHDVVSIDDYTEPAATDTDEWENAVDGMLFDTIRASTFKAYVLLVKDPTRVFVGTSTDDFSNSTAGVNVFQAADRYNAVACINGGEFLDNGGHGSGYAPLGLTYSKGKCVYDDRSTKTFIGFTNDNKLVVRESMTQKEAEELGIRDAVSFQNGNTLIEREGDNIKFYYADGNTGTSQRTAVGQRADGTVILIVTDGRTASSLGATHNDMIDLMVSYGAVSAGMLDGGSSAMMFYRDYYNKYNVDTSTLDQYQQQGLVNNYKAFTAPRRIPTFFMVTPES